MIVINVDIMICIMCDVLLLKCAPSVVLMFKYVLCTLLKSNIPPFFCPLYTRREKTLFYFYLWIYFFFFFFFETVTYKFSNFTSVYITNLVCYTYFHWLFNPECQHIFGKQTGYICTFSVSLIWAPKNNNNVVNKNRNIYASLNQYHNTE